MLMPPSHACSLFRASACVLPPTLPDPLEESAWSVESYSMFRLAISHVNANPVILPNHTLASLKFDTKGSESDALLGASNLLSHKDVVGLCGTASSGSIASAAVYASLRERPMISPASTSPLYVDKQARSMSYLLRTIEAQTEAILGLIAMVRESGWHHLAVFYSRHDYGEAVYDYFSNALPATITISFRGEHTYKAPAEEIVRLMSPLGLSSARIIVVLSTGPDVPTVLDALVAQGFYGEGYAVIVMHSKNRHRDMAASIGNQPGLLYIDEQVETTLNARQKLFETSWVNMSTVYEQSTHGAYNATSHLPLFANDSDTPFWDYGDPTAPNDWAKLMYDTVWVYAHALDSLTRRGISPFDGILLRNELVATSIEGLTGPLRFDPITQDRSRRVRLINMQSAAHSEQPAPVTIGILPLAPEGGAWVTTPIQWPGRAISPPLDRVVEVRLAAMLGFTASNASSAEAHAIFCAAKIASRHVNRHDGSVVPELASLTPFFKLRVVGYDTKSTDVGAVAALDAAHERGFDGIFGSEESITSMAVASRSLGMVQVSPTAKATALSDKALYPGFVRVRPSISTDSVALILFIRLFYFTWRTVAVLCENSAQFLEYEEGVRQAIANSGTMQMLSFTFEAGDVDSMQIAADGLRRSGVVVIVSVASQSQLAPLLDVADSAGLLSEHHAWFLIDMVGTDGHPSSVDSADGRWLSRATAQVDSRLARQLDGMLTFRFSPATSAASLASFGSLQAAWREPQKFSCEGGVEMLEVEPSQSAVLAYDAIAALALAANKSAQPNEASQLISHLKGLSFDGVSGRVELSGTGDRLLYGLRYQVSNVLIMNNTNIRINEVSLFSPNPSGNNAATGNGGRYCQCLTEFPEGMPYGDDGMLQAGVEGSTFNAPPRYGLDVCEQHDVGVGPWCDLSGSDVSDWCYDTWCYGEPRAPSPQNLSLLSF